MLDIFFLSNARCLETDLVYLLNIMTPPLSLLLKRLKLPEFHIFFGKDADLAIDIIKCLWER
jgi:hypothetical protein